VRQKQPVARDGLSMPGTNTLLGIGIAGAVALTIALIVVLSGRGGTGNVDPKAATRVRSEMAAAGCTFRAVPAESSGQHMSEANQKVTYNTFPPSSGVHNPTPAHWGNYRFPADPRQVVHNLEHGGIVVWYGPKISPKNRGALDAFYDESPNGIVITPLRDPYPRVGFPKHKPLGGKVALTAWTLRTGGGEGEAATSYVAICPSVNRRAFDDFRDAFRGKGPERYPISVLTPGT
jgi:hypothetical protein